MHSTHKLLTVLTYEFLFDVYQPWDQLLLRAQDLKGAQLKRYFKAFLESVPERIAAWDTVATEAGLPYERETVEFFLVGWRLIRDGLAAELLAGGSGGTWCCLMWDWAVHTSEVLRKRYDLEWKIRPGGNWYDAGRPYLGGIPNVHKNFGLTIINFAVDRIQVPDYLPTKPTLVFEDAERLCRGNTIDLFHLSPLALPDVQLSYIAGEPPYEGTLTKADFARHPKRESWEEYFRTGLIIEA